MSTLLYSSIFDPLNHEGLIKLYDFVIKACSLHSVDERELGFRMLTCSFLKSLIYVCDHMMQNVHS